MKFKTLALCAAAALAAPAFASIDPGNSSGNGELFFVVQDSTAKVSYTLDLGITMDSFLASAQLEAGYSLNVAVAADANFGAALFDFTGKQTAGDTLKWGVLALDTSGGGAGTRVLGTVASGKTETQMLSGLNSTKLNAGAGTTVAGNFFATFNGSTPDYSVNTSAVGVQSAKPMSYFGNTGGLTETLNSNLAYSVLNTVGTSSSFYLISGRSPVSSAPLLDRMNNSVNNGAWSFDGSALQYNLAAVPTAPVPEPESLALMLAGLAGLGMMVRRRRNNG